MPPPIRLLLVEDNPADVRLLRELLTEAGEHTIEVHDVSRISEAVAALGGGTGSFDALLVDLSLPDSQGLDTFARLHQAAPALPIVVLTGHDADQAALEAVKAGAQDYLAKGKHDGYVIARAMRYAIERNRLRIQLTESEQRFFQFFDHSPDYCFMVGTDGSVIDANKAAVEALGYAKSDLFGRSVLDLYTDASRARARELLSECRQGEIRNEELTIQTASGMQRTVLLSAASVGDPSGEIRHFAYVQRDVTDRMRAEERVRYLSSVVEQIPDGVVCTDTDFKITYVNRAAEQLFGWGSDELRGQTPDILNAEQQAAEIQQVIYETVSAGGVFEGEARNQRRDGTTFVCQFTVSPIFDGHGDILGYVGNQRDVTAQKERDVRLAQSDRLASVGLLAAGVSHEINNPLTYVLYNLERLVSELPELVAAIKQLPWLEASERSVIPGELTAEFSPEQLDELVRYATDATDGANRVRRIVKDLKVFSRADDDTVGPVSLNSVVDRAIRMAHNEIKCRARLVRDYGRLPPVTANDGRLAQLFLNLLMNAAHSIEAGFADENEIRVRTWHEGDSVLAEVRDTGCGIEEGDLPRVFDPFFTTKRVGVGSGLGLSICRSIVASLNGDISVDSEAGKGTHFLMRLPVGQTAVAEEAPPSNGELQQQEARGRVLVVDDEPLVRRALESILRREHHVCSVESGVAAKRILSGDEEFDAIVCDLIMPEVTGMDLHDWISQRSPELAARMLFVTGGAFTQTAQSFLEGIDNPLLDKPFRPRELQARLRELIARRQPTHRPGTR
ncbi:PAS domain S-box protein [Planctomycetota bacterium]